MSAALLALGLVLYPSTQLRFGGLPIGPGEALLIAWLGLAAARHALAGRLTVNLALTRLAMFWLALVLVQCVGMIVGLMVEPFQDYAGIAHDVAAYSLLIALGTMMALDLAAPVRRRRVVWRVVGFGAASALLQIAAGQGLFQLPGVDPWFYDRLRGWSLDPNQLGLFSVFLTLLAFHLAETAPRASEGAAAALLGLPPFAAGLLSQSDTFIVALIGAGAVFVALKGVTWISGADVGPTLRGALVVLCLMALPLAAIAAAPFWSDAAAQVEQRSAEVYADDGQGDTRLHLWGEAVEKGMESGLIGFGPGPHLTSKSYKEPPPYKFEAHNTSLDLLTQGGVVALSCFALLVGSTLHAAWRARLPALAALVVGMAVFSMFHFVVRHPIFWFAIVLCLLEVSRVAAGRAAGRPPAGEVAR